MSISIFYHKNLHCFISIASLLLKILLVSMSYFECQCVMYSNIQWLIPGEFVIQLCCVFFNYFIVVYWIRKFIQSSLFCMSPMHIHCFHVSVLSIVIRVAWFTESLYLISVCTLQPSFLYLVINHIWLGIMWCMHELPGLFISPIRITQIYKKFPFFLSFLLPILIKEIESQQQQPIPPIPFPTR